MSQPEPNWHPVSALPMIAAHIDAWLEENREQYEALMEAKDRPHIFDTPLVERIEEVYTKQASDFWLFEEQLALWERETLTPGQAREVSRLQAELAEIRRINAEILAFAAATKDHTIDKILAKDDIELALEVLSGKLKL